jgi:hypothetical protein
MLTQFDLMMFLYEADQIPGLLMRSHFAMLEEGAPKPVGHPGQAIATYSEPGDGHFRYPLAAEFLARLPAYSTQGVEINGVRYGTTPVWQGDVAPREEPSREVALSESARAIFVQPFGMLPDRRRVRVPPECEREGPAGAVIAECGFDQRGRGENTGPSEPSRSFAHSIAPLHMLPFAGFRILDETKPSDRVTHQEKRPSTVTASGLIMR